MQYYGVCVCVCDLRVCQCTVERANGSANSMQCAICNIYHHYGGRRIHWIVITSAGEVCVMWTAVAPFLLFVQMVVGDFIALVRLSRAYYFSFSCFNKFHQV